MTAQASSIVLGPGAITAPNPRDLDVRQLYEEIEWRVTERSVYGRTWTYDYRRWFNAQIRRYQREANRRGLPARRWQYDFQCEAEDIADLADTQARALT